MAPVSTLAGSLSPAAPVRAVLTAQKGSAQVLEPTEACLGAGRGSVRKGSLCALCTAILDVWKEDVAGLGSGAVGCQEH